MEKSSIKFLAIMLVVVIAGVMVAQFINASTKWTDKVTTIQIPGMTQ